MKMQQLTELESRLSQAGNLGDELTASWEAFQAIVMVADHFAAFTSDWFAMWMFVIPSACEGRDFLGSAPSARRDPAASVKIPDLRDVSEEEAADALSALAAALHKRLSETAAVASGQADARACAMAAETAAELRGLLTAA